MPRSWQKEERSAGCFNRGVRGGTVAVWRVPEMGVGGAGTLAGQPPCRHSHQTSLRRTQTCTAHPPLCSRVQLALLVNTSTREERSRWGLFIVPAPAYAFENPTQHCSQKCTEAQLASSNSALHFCTFTASFSPEMHFTVCALSQNKRGGLQMLAFMFPKLCTGAADRRTV